MNILKIILVALIVTHTACQKSDDAGPAKSFARTLAKTVRIVDEEGNLVPEFEAMYNTADFGHLRWRSGSDGELPEPYGFDESKVVDVIVRADGYAATIKRYVDDASAGPPVDQGDIILKRGERVECRLRPPPGRNWPEGFSPEVFFADLRDRVEMFQQPSSRKQFVGDDKAFDFNVPIESSEPGTYTIRLADDTSQVFIGIHSPGFLRFYKAGPFTAADFRDGVLALDVPSPARLEMHFNPSEKENKLPFTRVNVNIIARGVRELGKFLEVATESSSSPSLNLSLDDLPAGDYRCTLGTEPKPDQENLPGTNVNPGKFHETCAVQLAAGDLKRIDVEYLPPNLQSYKGDRTARLRFEKPDGQVASGDAVVVRFDDPHYGALKIFSGAVPDSGEITLSGIKALQSTDWLPNGYRVEWNDKDVGAFNFAGNEKDLAATFYTAPQLGDMAPNIEFIDITTGKSARLADFRGKMVWLEFWASWCGPCQEPMRQLVELAAKKREAWAGRVAFVPLSIDDESEHALRHVESRGWDSLPQYWDGKQDTTRGFNSSGARRFGVSGVPIAFLIDGKGRIVWLGHPVGNQGGESVAEIIEAEL